MLIKKEYQLQVGDTVSFTGPDCQNVERRKKYDVIVKEIYSHWVLGEIINHEFKDNTKIKMSMSNVDLVMQGIYSVEAIKDNGFNVSVKTQITDELIQKMSDYNKNHNSKVNLKNKRS